MNNQGDFFDRTAFSYEPQTDTFRCPAGRVGGAVTDTVHNHDNYAWRETHEGRDVWGKTCDLAFGYQGGLNAWRKFEPDRFTDAEVEQFKQDWRAAHPNIKKFWYAIDRATWEAVRNREQVIRCGRLLLKCTGSYLFIKLPSGRKLAYPYPRIEIEDLQHEVVVFKDASQGQWRDCRGGNGAYGGLWTENIVSGMCRDLLATAMLRLEAAGYRVVLHVHDEIIAEVPEDFGSVEEFTRLMIASPAWALGLPIAAKAWTGPRFSKT